MSRRQEQMRKHDLKKAGKQGPPARSTGGQDTKEDEVKRGYLTRADPHHQERGDETGVGVGVEEETGPWKKSYFRLGTPWTRKTTMRRKRKKERPVDTVVWTKPTRRERNAIGGHPAATGRTEGRGSKKQPLEGQKRERGRKPTAETCHNVHSGRLPQEGEGHSNSVL